MLADHTLFVVYRWLSWLVAGLLIIWQGTATQYVLFLIVAVGVNLLATLFVQPYIRLAHRLPAILSLDIVYCVALLFVGGGWSGPLALHALSGMVLPALLFGWRGGLMGGLLVVSLNLALYMANGITPTDMLETNRQSELLLMMVIAPLFGFLVHPVVERARHAQAQRQEARQRPRWTFEDLRANRPLDIASPNRPAGRARPQERRSGAMPELQHTPGVVVRAAEPNIEDLRRVLYAPLAPGDTELQTIINVLATRFSAHTGARSRVTVLGRGRTLAYAQHVVLVRLIQEALLNIQQHAQARHVELTLRYDAFSVALLVQDDGVGLPEGTHERSGFHALRAMHYRLAELGGRLDVFETQGGGVTVRATAPLE